jgi:hypothetical protein
LIGVVQFYRPLNIFVHFQFLLDSVILHRAHSLVHGYQSYTARMCTAIRRFEDHMAGVHCSVSCVCGPVPNHVLVPSGIFRCVGSWRRGRGAYLLLSITQSGLHARLGRPIPTSSTTLGAYMPVLGGSYKRFLSLSLGSWITDGS